MVYVCVICMATQRLLALNNEHRKLLGAIVSSAVRPEDWERLNNTVLLACWDCTKLVQSVAGFQGTALAGVNHLLSLLPAVEAKHDAAVLPEKEEAADPLALFEIESYIQVQLETDTKPLTQVDVKLESEPGAAASDSKPTAAELKTEDNTLNTEVVSETTSVDADQNTQNSSKQATLVTRCDTKTATFTHGPVRVTPRGNVVYGSMLRSQVISPMLPRLVPLPPRPANNARVASAPHMLNAATGPNKQINLLKRNLATSANRNGTKLARRAQAPVTAAPGGSMSIEAGAGNGQTDQQDIPQLPRLVPLPPRPAINARLASASYMLNAPTGPNKQINLLKRNLATLANRNGTKLARRAQAPVTAAPGGSMSIEAGAGNGQTDQQDILQRSAPNELRAHASRHSTRFCCAYCQFRTPDESVIRRHRCTNMPQQKKPRDIRKRMKRDPGDHKCTECGGRFQHEDQLQAHVKRLHSTPSAPLTCEVCKKEVRNKYKYYYHMYRHKKQEQRNLGPNPDLFCAECVKEFESKTAFENHMMSRKHFTKENWRFECDICKKKFPTKDRIGVHIRRMHVRPQRFKCDQCPKDYCSKRSLLRHALSHAPPTDDRAAADRRPHVCHLCAKAFTVQKSLREHLLMHEGKRPHACPLCPATFTYSACLYTHNQLKHLKIKRKWKTKAKSEKTKKAAAKATD